MHRLLLNPLNSYRTLLVAGALIGGLAATACDPKTIGDETAGEVTCKEGDEKPAGDGCNSCVCHDGGWACTEIACDGATTDGDEPVDTSATTGCDEDATNCIPLPSDTTGCDEDATNCVDPDPTTGDVPLPCEDGELPDSNGARCAPPGWCGNGVLQPELGEECDDGNLLDGDGCSSACQITESGSLGACVEPSPDDQFFFHNVLLVGDVLAVQLEHSGGCKEHEFAYCWDGAFAESDPVQVWTRISHDANGDQCESTESRAFEFDLSELKQAYQQAYQTQEGKIELHLDGWDEVITYTF